MMRLHCGCVELMSLMVHLIKQWGYDIMRYVLIVVVMLQASACCASNVVFLKGTGSTGKTSICHELGRLEETWKELSDDAIFFEELILRYKKEYTQEFELIAEAIEPSNIFHAIVRNQVLFKKLHVG